jgi:hypothetical protein
MVELAPKKLLLSWSDALDTVRCCNCSFTKPNAELHVCLVNHNRSRQCTYDGMFLTLIGARGQEYKKII